MSLNPPLMWAQDRKKLYITIKLQDIQNEEIIFNEDSFVFKARANGQDWDYKLELFDPVSHLDKETKYTKFGRYTQLNIRKKDTTKWWPRLAKTPKKLGNVGIDWEKWIDDDQADDVVPDDGSFDITNSADADFTSSSDDEEENKKDEVKPAEEEKKEEEAKPEEAKEESN